MFSCTFVVQTRASNLFTNSPCHTLLDYNCSHAVSLYPYPQRPWWHRFLTKSNYALVSFFWSPSRILGKFLPYHEKSQHLTRTWCEGRWSQFRGSIAQSPKGWWEAWRTATNSNLMIWWKRWAYFLDFVLMDNSGLIMKLDFFDCRRRLSAPSFTLQDKRCPEWSCSVSLFSSRAGFIRY